MRISGNFSLTQLFTMF